MNNLNYPAQRTWYIVYCGMGQPCTRGVLEPTQCLSTGLAQIEQHDFPSFVTRLEQLGVTLDKHERQQYASEILLLPALQRDAILALDVAEAEAEAAAAL